MNYTFNVVSHCYLSQFDCLVAVKRHHDPGKLKDKDFNWRLMHHLRGLVYDHHGAEHGDSKQAWHWNSS